MTDAAGAWLFFPTSQVHIQVDKLGWTRWVQDILFKIGQMLPHWLLWCYAVNPRKVLSRQPLLIQKSSVHATPLVSSENSLEDTTVAEGTEACGRRWNVEADSLCSW